MDVEQAMLFIAEYKLDLHPPVRYRHRDRKHIENRSMRRWAADELEIYILSHVDVNPIDACTMFIEQMYYYRGRYIRHRAMCDIAIAVAMTIRDLLGVWERILS